jgi:hypothetical protein
VGQEVNGVNPVFFEEKDSTPEILGNRFGQKSIHGRKCGVWPTKNFQINYHVTEDACKLPLPLLHVKSIKGHPENMNFSGS